MKLKHFLGALCALGFIAAILAANYVTTRYGMVPVGFGIMATAGTYFAGVTFVLRDAIQDVFGKLAVFALIVLGAILSFGISAPFIAVASAAAFLLSELSDLAIYSPLRERGYIRAALASNAVGSLVDTLVFLSLAGFPLSATGGQMMGKLAITFAVVAVVGVARFALRGRRA